MPNSPRPELSDILRFKSEQESFWSAAHAKWEERFLMYNNENIIEPPLVETSQQIIREPYTVHSGRAAEIADSFVGLSSIPPRHSVDIPGIGSKVAKRAESVEKFLNGYQTSVRFEQGENVGPALSFETGVYGATGVKVLPHPQTWRGLYPKQAINQDPAEYNQTVDDWQQIAPFPVAVWHVPARTWFPELDGRNVIRNLEVKEVTPPFILSRYGKALETSERTALGEMASDQKVQILEYIDDTWCGWYCASPGLSKELRVWRHRMPLPDNRAPVVLYEGLTIPDPRPEYHFRGLLDPVYEILKLQDFTLSRQATMVLIYWWLTIIEETKSAMSVEQLRKTDEFIFGGWNPRPEGTKISVMGPPPNMPDGESTMAFCEERLRMHWPVVLQGIIEGESSGYLYTAMRESSLTKAKPRLSNLAQGDADTGRMVFYAIGGLSKLLKRPDLRVYVRHAGNDKKAESIGVTWDEVKDLLPLIRAERDPDMPPDEAYQLDNAAKAMSDPIRMPRNRALPRYLKVEDPETMEDERIGQDISDSDPIKRLRIQEVLTEMDIKWDEIEGESAEQALAQPDLPPAFAEALGGAMAGPPLEAPPSPNGEMPTPDAGVAPLVPPQPTAPAQGNIGPGRRAGTRTRPSGPHKRGAGSALRGAS